MSNPKTIFASAVAFLAVLMASSTLAQTVQSDSQPAIQQLASVAPSTGVPRDIAAFTGNWTGNWGGNLDASIIVEDVTPETAKVVYTWGDSAVWNLQRGSTSYQATITPGQPATLTFGKKITFTVVMNSDLASITVTRVSDYSSTVGAFKKSIMPLPVVAAAYTDAIKTLERLPSVLKGRYKFVFSGDQKEYGNTTEIHIASQDERTGAVTGSFALWPAAIQQTCHMLQPLPMVDGIWDGNVLRFKINHPKCGLYTYILHRRGDHLLEMTYKLDPTWTAYYD